MDIQNICLQIKLYYTDTEIFDFIITNVKFDLTALALCMRIIPMIKFHFRRMMFKVSLTHTPPHRNFAK